MTHDTRPTLLRRAAAGAGALAAGLLLAACSTSAGGASLPSPVGPAAELRLGYFANVTHAPALVGVGQGRFADALAAAGTPTLTTQVLNAGPSAIEALNAGAIDATFIGPNPAINGFVQSEGESLRVVAGTTSGGAQLVVRAGIDGVEALRGTELATPQLGNTQDVALRAWLADNGLRSPLSGGGDVTITPTENAQTLQLFQDGKIDGAWLPEPWSSRLVLEAGGVVLLDEKDLWPDGEFVTTHLVVSADYLAEHPETVTALVAGLEESIDWIDSHPEEAPAAVNAQLAAAGGKALDETVLDRAFGSLEFSTDPHAGALGTVHQNAVDVGVTKPASIEGIYDLRLLNALRAAAGEQPASAAGLGLDQS